MGFGAPLLLVLVDFVEVEEVVSLLVVDVVVGFDGFEVLGGVVVGGLGRFVVDGR